MKRYCARPQACWEIRILICKTTSVVLWWMGLWVCERAEEVDSPKFRCSCSHWCPFLPVFFSASAKNMIWPWSTNCWMILSWQPGSTESGRSWTHCWSRTSIISSRYLRTLKLPPRNSRTPALLTVLRILFEQKPGLLPSLWQCRPNPVPEASSLPAKDKAREKPVLMQWSPGFRVLCSSILELWSSSEQAYLLCSH